jgi:hypothetical protein
LCGGRGFGIGRHGIYKGSAMNRYMNLIILYLVDHFQALRSKKAQASLRDAVFASDVVRALERPGYRQTPLRGGNVCHAHLMSRPVGP